MTDLKQNERCVLCLDEKRSPVRIQCGHSFCNECLTVYKSYNKYAWANKCPICRGVLKDKKRVSKFISPNSNVRNENNGESARTAGVALANVNDANTNITTTTTTTTSSPSVNPQEQACILEELIAIATEQYHTPSSTELEDNEEVMDMEDNYDEDEGDNYFSDSDEDLYYYFDEDEQSSDHQASIVDVEDYEADILADSDVTVLSDDAGNRSHTSSSISEVVQSSDSDSVVLVDDSIIIVVD